MAKQTARQKTNGYFWMSAPILLLVLVFFLSGTGISQLALASTVLAAPESARLLLQEYLHPASEPQPQSSGVTQKIAKESDPQGKNTTPQSAEKTTALTETPADVAALIAQAKAQEAGSKAGTIVEKNYNKSGATSAFGSVRVKNMTQTKSLNIEKVLAEKPEITITDKQKPAVLLFHTHTTESFQLVQRSFYTAKDAARSTQADRNMVRIGQEIKAQLEAAGFRVIHDTTTHDTAYNGAYSRSRETVKKHLQENPDIQVVLDVHRDAVHTSSTSKVKTAATINGKKAAQVMIITGAEEGDVKSFPNWKKNLCFSLHLQKAMEETFPGLTRPVMFCQRKYNMDLSANNILLEVGTDANTLEEAVYAGRLVGVALAKLLAQHQKGG